MIGINDMCRLSFVLSIVIAALLIFWTIENSEYYVSFRDFTRKWVLLLPIILVVNFALIYDFYHEPTTTEITCDLIIRENVPYIHLGGKWINLSTRFHRNYVHSDVLVQYIDHDYRGWGNIVYPDKYMIQKVD